MEVWRDIPGFGGVYAISDKGRVKSKSRRVRNTSKSERVISPRVLKPFTHTGGYLVVKLRGQAFYIHRLVCEMWHGIQPDGHEVRHLDGNKTNNIKDNLCWGTRKENMADRPRLNEAAVGERHGMSKLVAAQVLEIRADSRRPIEIATEYKVSDSLIKMIKRRAIWKHI